MFNIPSNTTRVLDNTAKIDNTYALDLQEAYGYVKTIDDGQDVSDWTQIAGTLSQDTTNVKIGSGSTKLIENDNVSGPLIVDKLSISADLTKLNNGKDSGDDDYILFIYYVSNASLLTNVQLNFSQLTSPSAQRKTYVIDSGIVTGWNFTKIKKSAFISEAGSSWSGIQSIRLAWNSLANAQNEYVSFQLIQLVAKDAVGDYPNPLSSQGRQIINGEPYVGLEFGKIVLKYLDGVVTENSTPTTKTYNEFKINHVAIVGSPGSCNGPSWFVDSNNYVVAFVSSNLVFIRKQVAGVLTTLTTEALSVSNGDKVTYTVEKDGDNFSVDVYLNGDLKIQHNFIQSYSSKGFLSASHRAVSDYIESQSITQIPHAHHADIAEVAKSITVKRQAGAFIADELSYGEFGLDTSNNRLYMKYSATQVIYFGGTVV